MTSLEGWDSAIELRPRRWSRLPDPLLSSSSTSDGGRRCRCRERTTRGPRPWRAMTPMQVQCSLPTPGRGRTPAWHFVVGEAGFEPATSCSQSRCAAGLRYSPKPCGPDLGISIRPKISPSAQRRERTYSRVLDWRLHEYLTRPRPAGEVVRPPTDGGEQVTQDRRHVRRGRDAVVGLPRARGGLLG